LLSPPAELLHLLAQKENPDQVCGRRVTIRLANEVFRLPASQPVSAVLFPQIDQA